MFEDLDDIAPPEPSPARHQQVTEGIRARHRARRRRAAGVAVVALILMVAAGAWGLARRNDQNQVTTGLTDRSWTSFCAAATRIQADDEHPLVGSGSVLVPNDATGVTNYAALSTSVPEADLQAALKTGRTFLLSPLRSPTPAELHAARQVAEALTLHCSMGTSIFGVIVNRTTVTLPTFGAPASAADLAAIRWALVGLTQSEADQVARRSGWTVRVVERDGNQLVVTKDHVANRIDVATGDEIVMSTSVG